MATPKVLADYNWFADGIGKVGLVPKIKLPDFTKVMEEYMAGGMAAPIEIFMGCIEAQTMTVTLAEPDPQVLKLFKFTNGEEKMYTFRSALTGRGEAEGFVVKCQAQLKNFSMDDIERKKLSNCDIEMTLVTYKLERKGEVIFDVDADGGQLIVDGKDLRADINNLIGN
ncbi:phage major tail tube protein [Endozoicomonas ascidiicola]|uniref:phage major tail tube protein n=1 Tax=Endozoicomonas ascidiicola TaxID=1698521 RepID=UPI000834A5C4|nr:phage major tail tube protein [Endozoicomonas ascidiicola]